MKKIISLLWGYKPGGVTEYVKSISKTPDTSKLHIKTVIIQKRSWGHDFSAFDNTDYEVIYFDNVFTFSWLSDLIKIIKRDTPIFLFAHAFNATIVAALVKLTSKKKFLLVCSYHGKYLAPTVSRKVMAPIYNNLSFFIYSKISKGVVCVSGFSKKELEENSVPENKIAVIYNGIPEQPIFSNSFMYEKSKDELLIGVVCRLVPLKGVDILIEAIRDISSIKLLVIGDGPMKAELMSKAKEMNDKVAFLGNQDNVPDWLNVLDIFVLPSFVENHSISILEAMRQSKAIITTDIGGNPESILNSVNGILVPAGDIAALKEAILYFKDNPKKIIEFGKNAQEKFILNFTDIKMHKNTMYYFKKILKD